jgi:SNF2 family DNA or RNA helicase
MQVHTMQARVSPKHRKVAVALGANGQAVRNLFPQMQEIVLDGELHAVVPHGVTETFHLRRLGYDVPAPILSQYNWPGIFTPFEAQKKTCALLTMNLRAYVLNDMGTGKTAAALWAYDYLRSNKLAKKLLVLSPLSTMKFTWAREVFNTVPHRKYVVLHGDKKKRLGLLGDPDADIFIINHDGVKVIEQELAKRLGPDGDIDTIVIDELAIYRSGQAARTKALRKLAQPVKWVWGMTGSPIPNSPTDVWAQASIVTPSTVPKYYSHFRDQVMLKVSQFIWTPKPNAVQTAFQAMRPAVRYALEDVVELPECIERTVDVSMGVTQAKIYKAIMDKCYAAVQSKEITAANAGAAMTKLLQISLGWVYTKDGSTAALDNQDRVTALMDAINSTDRKCLVFAPFKHAMHGISEALTSEGIEHAMVSGDTPINERSEVFNLFQNTDKYRVIVAHPQCLAHGITLTAADTVIWFAPVTSLDTYEQANHRIRRVGQKHKQLLLHLQATPVERRIYMLLRNKQRVQDQLLSLFEGAHDE